ncbi:MAG: GDSL-type esterase/lipase family protein [Clostridiales Family XIII bacterium]|nr:GDSL-type esterase/lipase family protein [Clostridiales Family XIII bacterium]
MLSYYQAERKKNKGIFRKRVVLTVLVLLFAGVLRTDSGAGGPVAPFGGAEPLEDSAVWTAGRAEEAFAATPQGDSGGNKATGGKAAERGAAASDPARTKAGTGLRGGAREASLLPRRAVAPPKTEDAAPAEDEYFADALFIGDSRTEGLFMYSTLAGATFYFSKGMAVDKVFSSPNVTVDGVKMTVGEALGKKRFGKVYVMLGVNELGWVYTDMFIEKYGQLIDRIKETQPGAPVFVQSIFPVTAKKSAADKIYNNPTIDRFNALIEEMAKDKGVAYLAVDESVQDEDGCLPQEATVDGVHLNKAYCLKWEDYLRRHTAG